jgi:mono/diheme cytochrome c family protein
MRAYGIISLALGLIAATAAVAAEDDAEQIKRGEALIQSNCASCHAFGLSDVSQHKSAPPFRTLSRNYEIEALEEALAEGLLSGHPDMPEFKFESPEVGAIIAFLKSIQVR